MRKIKFRGKRMDSGEWVYGDLFQKKDGLVAIRRNYHTWAEGPYDLPDPSDDEDYIVYPETVGQYTGLKDRNGKGIYEGDIIGGSNGSINGYPWPFTLLIKWNDAACGFNTPNWGYMDSTHYYEVVGNRWDNPELLEGKE